MFDFSDYNVFIVKAMLQFVYTGDYVFPFSVDLGSERNLGQVAVDQDTLNCLSDHSSAVLYEPCFHIMMYVIGAYLRISLLKSAAVKCLFHCYAMEQDKNTFIDNVLSFWYSLKWYDDAFTDILFRLTHRGVIYDQFSPPASDSGTEVLHEDKHGNEDDNLMCSARNQSDDETLIISLTPPLEYGTDSSDRE